MASVTPLKQRCSEESYFLAPLGLRRDTEYVQSHLLGAVVAKFMVGAAGSMADRWSAYLRGKAAVATLGPQVGYMANIPDEQSASYTAALAIYFLARRQEEFLTPLHGRYLQ